MATSRWSFTHEGRAFAFNLSTQVLVEEFVWRAEIWCDQMEVGQLAGRLTAKDVPSDGWRESFLKERAAKDVPSDGWRESFLKERAAKDVPSDGWRESFLKERAAKDVPSDGWRESFLKERAAEDVQQAIKARLGVDW